MSFSIPSDSKLKRILVVDDEPSLRSMLKTNLELAGFEVLTANHGQQALDVIERHGMPHLAMVDILMPVMDGLTFCRTLHEFADLPLIMLSSAQEKKSSIQFLEHYAQDIITKPFSTEEVLARVQDVLRRIGEFDYTLPPVIEVDEYLAVDLFHQQVTAGGQQVALTPAETKLLHILIRQAGHPVSTELLIRRLWPLREGSKYTLRVHLRNLRHKIEPAPRQPRYLLTHRSIGYSFAVSSRDDEHPNSSDE